MGHNERYGMVIRHSKKTCPNLAGWEANKNITARKACMHSVKFFLQCQNAVKIPKRYNRIRRFQQRNSGSELPIPDEGPLLETLISAESSKQRVESLVHSDVFIPIYTGYILKFLPNIPY